MDMAAWMFLHTTQCLVSGGTPYASVRGALRGLYMAGDLSLCLGLCVHEVLLVMSPIIQATGQRIVSPVLGSPRTKKIRAELSSNGSDVRPAGLTPHTKSTPRSYGMGIVFCTSN